MKTSGPFTLAISQAPGTADLIAAVANKKVRVLSGTISGSVAGTYQFQSWDGAVATNITGAVAIAGAPAQVGTLDALHGQALRLIATTATITGHIVYELVA